MESHPNPSGDAIRPSSECHAVHPARRGASACYSCWSPQNYTHARWDLRALPSGVEESPDPCTTEVVPIAWRCSPVNTTRRLHVITYQRLRCEWEQLVQGHFFNRLGKPLRDSAGNPPHRFW